MGIQNIPISENWAITDFLCILTELYDMVFYQIVYILPRHTRARMHAHIHTQQFENQ